MEKKEESPPDEPAAAAIKEWSAKRFRRRWLEIQADFKLLGYRGTLRGCSGEDVVSEAIVLTLDGTRPWKQDYAIEAHLKNCVKNIAHGVWKKAGRETDLTDTYFYENSPESQLDAERAIAKLRGMLKNVTELQVLQLAMDGHKPPEIKKELHIDAATLLAAKKAIYRATRKLMEEMKADG